METADLHKAVLTIKAVDGIIQLAHEDVEC